MASATQATRPKVPTMGKRAGEGSTDGPEPVPTRDASGTGDTEDRIRTYLETQHRRVVAAVSLWTGSIDDATDAVTDAIGRAWERLDRGHPIDNLAAWVTHAAMNQIRSAHRHREVAGRKRHLIAVVDSEGDPTTDRAGHLDLRRALDHLTARQRNVIALYYGLDLPVAQIAETLDVAPGTVKATLHQARTRLATLLDDTATTATTTGASDD